MGTQQPHTGPILGRYISFGLCGWGVEENGRYVTEEIPNMLPKSGIWQCYGQPGQGVIFFLLKSDSNKIFKYSPPAPPPTPQYEHKPVKKQNKISGPELIETNE